MIPAYNLQGNLFGPTFRRFIAITHARRHKTHKADVPSWKYTAESAATSVITRLAVLTVSNRGYLTKRPSTAA